MPLSKEFQDLINEIRGGVHAGEPIKTRIGHIIRETLDVVGSVVRAIDEKGNRAEDLDVLRTDIKYTISEIGDIIFKDRPFMRNAVPLIAGPGADAAVAALADHGTPVVKFIDDRVLPELRELRDTIDHAITQLSGG